MRWQLTLLPFSTCFQRLHSHNSTFATSFRLVHGHVIFWVYQGTFAGSTSLSFILFLQLVFIFYMTSGRTTKILFQDWQMVSVLRRLWSELLAQAFFIMALLFIPSAICLNISSSNMKHDAAAAQNGLIIIYTTHTL